MSQPNDGLTARVTLEQALADTTYYNFEYIGEYRYFLVAMADLAASRCPFCDLDTTLNRVEFENTQWRVWRNPVSQKSTVRYQFVVAHREHAAQPFDGLKHGAGESLFAILRRIQRAYDLPGGGLLMRFGDPTYNAGTVRHPHGNLMIPDGSGEVRLPLAKKQGKIQEARVRLAAFEKLRQAHVTIEEARQRAPEVLTDEYEYSLVVDRLAPAT